MLIKQYTPTERHQTIYKTQYNPNLLFPIPRQHNRDKLNIQGKLPFYGCDIWTAFEVSWLNFKGRPEIATVDFYVPCQSPNLIESKSFKIYLNSFNMTRFDSAQTVRDTLMDDLSEAAGKTVKVNMVNSPQYIDNLSGICLDDLDIYIDTYHVSPEYLKTIDDNIIEESLYSYLLKSNCPTTGLPDWGCLQINYKGKKIHRENLLRYIISFRNHAEFHEHCVERIFTDIINHCQPEELSVYARYTRRGGLDINPYRTTERLFTPPENLRLFRQ